MSNAEFAGKFAAGIVVIFLVSLIMGLLFAWPVMWCWNYVMPEVFGLPVIDYWHAFWMKFLFFLLIPTTPSYSSK